MSAASTSRLVKVATRLMRFCRIDSLDHSYHEKIVKNVREIPNTAIRMAVTELHLVPFMTFPLDYISYILFRFISAIVLQTLITFESSTVGGILRWLWLYLFPQANLMLLYIAPTKYFQLPSWFISLFTNKADLYSPFFQYNIELFGVVNSHGAIR